MTVPPITQLATEFKITAENEVAKSTMRSWCKSSWRGIASEFLSTSMLVLFGCMSCIPVEGINMSIYSPFGFGFVVMFNIQIFGHISGAYMNPAVTLAAMIWGSISVPVGICYMIVECAGALVGFGILSTLSPVDVGPNNVCVTAPHIGLNDFQSLGIEIALTAALIFINCGVWDPINATKQDSAPIKFGLTIVGLSLVGGPLTGASMNPARSLGPAVWTGYWDHQWIYWVGPFIGSVVSVLIYKYVFLKKHVD
ncbi:hypothetical protein PYW08_001517 [Mythimna loreyi]|uniref:Uncharacterized protein n=1 Tax=Mythimna loreyi TaxID=667449 RepID=A0ACC2R4R8_9NEOP|nr:hypothetical protein PYW08_001517 [Mythimna loreyi]